MTSKTNCSCVSHKSILCTSPEIIRLKECPCINCLVKSMCTKRCSSFFQFLDNNVDSIVFEFLKREKNS